MPIRGLFFKAVFWLLFLLCVAVTLQALSAQPGVTVEVVNHWWWREIQVAVPAVGTENSYTPSLPTQRLNYVGRTCADGACHPAFALVDLPGDGQWRATRSYGLVDWGQAPVWPSPSLGEGEVVLYRQAAYQVVLRDVASGTIYECPVPLTDFQRLAVGDTLNLDLAAGTPLPRCDVLS